MKKLWYYLKNHVKEDFNTKHYASAFLLLCILITLNYTYDFEDSYLDNLHGFKKFAVYFLFYSIPYFTVILSYSFFYKKNEYLKQNYFWITSLTGLTILSLDSSMPFLQPIINNVAPIELQYWIYKLSVNLVSFLTVCLPIVLFYKYVEKHDRNLYGLAPKQFDMKPYLLILLIMLPLLLAASTQASFLRQYPMYKTSGANDYLGVEEWVTALAYEFAYGADFVTVELLFRGFMVIGMMQYLGRGAVLSMAVIYCMLHFGKPAGEAISSVIGGYILGIFAFETRSIWGGIIVHVGIAWMMELIAHLTKTYFLKI